MRIAMLGVKAVPTIGGVARYVEELGTRLVERGHEVTVYCRPHFLDSNGPYRGMERVGVRGLRGKHLDAITHTLTSLAHARRQRFDVLHFHCVGPGALAPLASWGSNAALVVTAHGTEWMYGKWGRLARRILKASAGTCAKYAAGWIAVSEHVANECAGLTGRRPEVIPSGTSIVDTPEPCELRRFGLEPGEYLFCAARLTPEKGIHYLLDAFRRVSTSKRLVIAGACTDGSRYGQELEALADERTHFLGFVKDRALAELFGHAYLYCQASDVEGLPMSVLEAMNYGTGVLASDIPPHCEALNGHGFTFRAGDATDLAEQLTRLLREPDLTKRTGEAARRYVHQHRTWDLTTDHYESLYEGLLGAIRAGHPTGVPPGSSYLTAGR